jgi:hypothetical protein
LINVIAGSHATRAAAELGREDACSACSASEKEIANAARNTTTEEEEVSDSVASGFSRKDA